VAFSYEKSKMVPIIMLAILKAGGAFVADPLTEYSQPLGGTTQLAGGTLTVRHGPMRWSGNHTLSVDDILQFYCSDRTHTNRQRHWTSYQLNVLKKDGTKLVLLGSLTEREEALFLEERLEQKLGIAPRQVPGELRS